MSKILNGFTPLLTKEEFNRLDELANRPFRSRVPNPMIVSVSLPELPHVRIVNDNERIVRY